MNSPAEIPPIDPNCLAVIRTVRIGGMSKLDLLAEFQKKGIELNESARTLFANEQFTTSPVTSSLVTVEISVANLGYAEGAVMAQIHERATELGLSLCPLELGPHLRLQFLDQSEGELGQPPVQHRAPPGSMTVVSRPLADDDETPKGFYLRRIKGVLWLRGYRSEPAHLWSPEDRLIFCQLDDQAAVVRAGLDGRGGADV